MKLIFIIPTSTLRTSTKKSIKSIAGGQERVDVISRCLLNADRWKSRLPVSIEMIFYLSHPEEQQALYINLDANAPEMSNELSSTIKMLELLKAENSDTSRIEKDSFEDVVRNNAKESMVFYLSPEGSVLSKDNLNPTKESSFCFILGSQHDLSEEQEKILQDIAVVPISLGSKNYLASHVITVVCNHLFVNL